MALQAGSRLGAFEILAPIGAGGMGEVYRALDRELNRTVAIKVLPELFAADPERLARFEREAQALASLNHPNIAQIYGVERSETTRALVMELVEGEDLSHLLRRGALPLGQVLPLARQIAEALEAAHERGIVHRDLKPANIKLRENGTVKVLDFGLAKTLDPVQASGVDAANSPTLTSPVHLAHGYADAGTQMGMILGTAAYMAPEQAKGRPVDRRADVWAFGCVLFEMLTGRRAFRGDDVTDTLAAIVRAEPEWSTLPVATPTPIHRLLRRCLEKDRGKRLDSMTAARLDIDDALVESGSASTTPGRASARVRAIALLSLLLLTAALAFWAATSMRPAPEPSGPLRLRAELGAPVELSALFGTALALSPDGQTLAFVATDANRITRLYVRRLDELEATELTGTEGALSPFFSPDGQWIGYFAGARLRKVPVTGGASISLASVEIDRGATWTKDGRIVFTPTPLPGGRLMRVSEAGGAVEPAVIGEIEGHVTQRWPQVLPDGSLLFTSHTSVDSFEDASVFVARPGEAPKLLLTGGYFWRYFPSGHLLFVHAGTLFAVSFDVNALRNHRHPGPGRRGHSKLGDERRRPGCRLADGPACLRRRPEWRRKQIAGLDGRGREHCPVGEGAAGPAEHRHRS
jgi:serine/threonine-protein kinase